FGLAGLPSLPMSRVALVFSQFDFLENYSFAVYVIQFICYSVWPQTGEISVPLFLIFVISLAVVVARTIQQPVQKLWAAHPISRCFVPFILATALACSSLLPDPQRPTSSLSSIPARVRLDERML
ncbi:unnamed protein product, partial [Polarella glacialis]